MFSRLYCSNTGKSEAQAHSASEGAHFATAFDDSVPEDLFEDIELAFQLQHFADMDAVEHKRRKRAQFKAERGQMEKHVRFEGFNREPTWFSGDPAPSNPPPAPPQRGIWVNVMEHPNSSQYTQESYPMDP